MVFTGLDKAELIGLEAYMKEKGVKVEREEKRGWENVVEDLGEGDINVSDDSRSQQNVKNASDSDSEDEDFSAGSASDS